ncbi:glycosyltransferase family 1 protein [Terriglobus sp. TAA 43]|uniref:glycosyltransferase family 4 protein n=1 Tax=Terriglobus sp. TAA 43 TaxID=278961 RepID=UPI0018DCA342|nr:glycosyltransferase family 1 protein [Terriglobus sp. TAA 43]
MNILSYVHLRNIYRSTGVGRVSRELTERLHATPDVNLHVLADPADHARVIPLVGDLWQSYQYHFFKSDTSAQQLRWVLTNRPAAEHYWSEVDLVHCTAESYVPVRKARLVVTCHDAQHFEAGAHRQSVWLMKQRLKWRLLFARLEREVDMLQMISHFAAERTAHFFPNLRDRLCVVPNAASDSFFAPADEEGKAILHQLGVVGKPFVLVPGGLQFRKNADLILDAWPAIAAAVPDVVLVVINHVDETYLPRAKVLGDRCVLAGFQEERQLVALYQAATLVWFPTLYDGFGMPVIEAMASGTPVISSDTTGIPEVAGNAGVLLSPADAEAHVQTIVELLRDESARAALVERGRVRAADFTWDKSTAKLLAAFRSIV